VRARIAQPEGDRYVSRTSPSVGAGRSRWADDAKHSSAAPARRVVPARGVLTVVSDSRLRGDVLRARSPHRYDFILKNRALWQKLLIPFERPGDYTSPSGARRAV
jgi:hypothetical protein